MVNNWVELRNTNNLFAVPTNFAPSFHVRREELWSTEVPSG